MARYRLDFLASLARQMAFIPAGVRERQLTAAEDLLLSIDPAKAYPPTYVVFRITEFHPPTPPAELVTGLALQHDLGLLIEQVSMTLDQRTTDRAEPVLRIEDLVAQFNVTSKTIQRWRRRGLSARRFIFPDGKRRVGFRLAVVEQFLAAQRDGVTPPLRNPVCADAAAWALTLRHLRRLAIDGRRPLDEICHRSARRVDRSALSIEAELAKRVSEGDAPEWDVGRRTTVAPVQAAAVLRWSDGGFGLAEIARRTDLPRSTVYRVLLAERIRRSLGRRMKFLDDPLYHQADAESVVAALVAQKSIVDEAENVPAERAAAGLSSELRSLCHHPVLSPTQERALFLQYNFRKYQAVLARRRLDPAKARLRQLKAIDELLARATEVRNTIVRCNLRLVVAVARKHVRPGVALTELVSEGSLTLMRATESFDTRKGNKFSTYATLALMKGFARSVGRLQCGCGVTGLSLDQFRSTVQSPADRLECTDRVGRLLDKLDAEQRSAVCEQFGFRSAGGQAANSTPRITRRLQRSAMCKLREATDSF